MKKVLIAFSLMMTAMRVFAQEFVFPPELNWWIDEIKKVEPSVSLDKFEFVEETFILEENHPLSLKNKLYPVFKKWNFYGDRFAYNDVYAKLCKEKSGKYSVSTDVDSVFGIFDRKENLLFTKFFGSSEWINSFCWVTDSRIVLVGTSILPPQISNDNFLQIAFIIYDYQIKDAKITVREYRYPVIVKRTDWEKLKLNWTEQRSDYFESQKDERGR
ncbi:hypothetical protein [Treponema sp.]|uniref:hypothetical protein n=1 Tax=Treponema sp. TaxID=166 RepID=UPI00298D7FDE|nr:hypothetical protein [Treponema sp.]MCR5613790.1 hypothetical protein [Treponema sp.]